MKNSVKNYIYAPLFKPKIVKSKKHFSYRKFKQKLLRIFAAVLLFVLSLVPHSIYTSFADDTSSQDIEKMLSDAVLEQLRSLDLSGLEGLVGSGSSDIFTDSFRGTVDKIISGEFGVGFDNVFSAVLSLAFSGLLAFLPYLFSIVAISVLNNLLVNARSKTAGNGTQGIIGFVCFSAVVVLVFALLAGLITSAGSTVSLIEKQISLSFPVLITLMTALGSYSSAAVYQPVVATLTGVVTQIMTYVILPLYIFAVVFSVVGNISPSVKLKKLADFFGGMSKWIIVTVLFVFMTFLAIQGISAATYDGISVRTAKYAISHYVPIVGGHLSDGIHIMMAGTVLIKNAVGVASLLLLAATVLAPVLKIAVFSLGLRLCGAIIEPISDGKTSAFITETGKHTAMLAAVVLSVAFMYLITVVLIICTGNAVVH